MKEHYSVVKKHFSFRVIIRRACSLVAFSSLFLLSNSHAQNIKNQVDDELDAIVLDEPATDAKNEPEVLKEDEPEVSSEFDAAILEQSVIQISTELNQNLDAQFQRIRELEKTEDAFSAKLGEEYLNYGLLLKRAGRVDEAREVIVDALHISKVNNGVYAIEQRPMLRALFKVNLLLGNSEEVEENFEKLVWLENKHPSEIGFYSLDLVLELGHHFLDRYFIRGTRDDVSLALLDSAAKYFSYAIRQYGNASIDQQIMPYGELSLVHYYRSRLIERNTRQRDFTFSRQQTVFDRVDQINTRQFFEQTFSKTELYSKLHLRKAKEEENQQQIVEALIALGDSNLLFKRKKAAANYYKLAWEEAQKLSPENPLVLSFEKPVRLPAFNFAVERDEARRAGASYDYLPVIVDIDVTGKVVGTYDEVIGAPNKKIASRARRLVKNSRFRPAIINGELMPVKEHEETIRVLVSKK